MFRHKRLFLSLLIGLIVVSSWHLPLYADPIDDRALSEPDVFAQAAILMDTKTGQVLYGKNQHTRLYPASITKVMTALVAIETRNPTEKITMSKEAVYGIERNSSHIGLDVGEEISLDQGLHALLLDSANEVANGIAELSAGSIAEFARRSTQRAKELGAYNTNFKNPHGLHDPDHYTTAYDMALIAQAAIQNPYFQEIMNTHTYQIPPTNKCSEIRYLSQSHKLLHEGRYGRSYRPDVIGGKTGYTSVAGNTLVTMAKRGDMELICVVLKSSPGKAYADTNAILDYGFENFKAISLHQASHVISSVPMYTIKSGQLIHMADCDIHVDRSVEFLGNSNIKERMIDTQIELPDKIDKEMSEGDVVGTISYNYKGETLSTNNLVIKSINHLSSMEPAVFPQKPRYAVSGLVIPSNLQLMSSTLVAGVIGFVLFMIYMKRKRYNQIKKKTNQILRFSKKIK